MKRLLLLAALGAAASVVPSPAHANHHLCVSRYGRDLVCVPYLDFISTGDPICVSRGGTDIVCV